MGDLKMGSNSFISIIAVLFLASFVVFGCAQQQTTPSSQNLVVPTLPAVPSGGQVQKAAVKPLKGDLSDEEISAIVVEAMQEKPPSTEIPANPSEPQEGSGSAQSSASAGVQTSGNYEASLNYKVAVDGFKFENYGKDDPARKNLGAMELQKMFGDSVCAVKQGTCVLTPPAEQWAKQNNDAMGTGHCEGMAALSLLFNIGKRSTDDFGAKTAYELSIDGNEKLQREIAYWWATQTTEPTSTSTIKLSPNEIVEKLKQSFSGGESAEKYTLGIYKRDMSGGHAITPFAIEDRGEGTIWILVYDNNYPGVDRAVLVDTKANTWKYSASTNPSEAASEYDGDASTKNLELTPTSVRMQAQTCAFCEGTVEQLQPSASQSKGSLKQSYNEIWIDGKADLLAIDGNDKRLGILNGSVVQEIPGARYVAMKGANPVYQIPSQIGFRLEIDGARLKEKSSTDIVMIGPGYDLGILNISVAPGTKDTAVFSSSGNSMTYAASSKEAIEVIYGIETAASDYEFSMKGVDLESGSTLTSALDTGKGRLSLSTKGNTKDNSFLFEMTRIDDNGSSSFGNDEGIVLSPNDTIYFNYAKWSGNKGVLIVEIDSGSKGTIDESVELKDGN